MSPSVALVTGATGLVGSYIVDRLIADGWSVRALARAPERARPMLPGSLQIFPGDVLDESSFIRAAAGSHVIFHAAANITVRGGWEAYRATNVEGTRNAIMAAELAKARLLHVSSVSVYGPSARYQASRRGDRTDEHTALAPLSERAYYARSKRESEELVLRAHAEGRVWGAAVRPAAVYGRRDRQFIPRVAALLRVRAIPLLRGGRSTLALVHAGNVAEGAVLAATTDAAGGQTYNLANDYEVSVRRFFELAGEGLDLRPLFFPVPLALAKGAFRGLRWVTRILSGGRFNLVSSAAVAYVSEDNPFSSERARRELAWAPSVHPEVGIPDAFRWWKEHR